MPPTEKHFATSLARTGKESAEHLRDEGEAESRFEEILCTYPRYGKNEAALARYLGYHREIQALINR